MPRRAIEMISSAIVELEAIALIIQKDLLVCMAR